MQQENLNVNNKLITPALIVTLLLFITSCATRGTQYSQPKSGNVTVINFHTTSLVGNIGIRVFDSKKSCKDYYSGKHVILLNDKVIWGSNTKDFYSEKFQTEKIHIFTIYSNKSVYDDRGTYTLIHDIRCAKSFMVTPESNKVYKYVFSDRSNNKECGVASYIKNINEADSEYKKIKINDISQYCGMPQNIY